MANNPEVANKGENAQRAHHLFVGGVIWGALSLALAFGAVFLDAFLLGDVVAHDGFEILLVLVPFVAACIAVAKFIQLMRRGASDTVAVLLTCVTAAWLFLLFVLFLTCVSRFLEGFAGRSLKEGPPLRQALAPPLRSVPR
jgi:hypothetical protein